MKLTLLALFAASVMGVASLTQTAEAVRPIVPQECVDISKAKNLSVKWSAKNTVTVSIKDNKKACNDATLFLSAYLLPSTWDGRGFNATAMPQTLYKSVSTTMKSGSNKSVTLTVPVPEACKNIQADVYYAPEQTVIQPNDRIGDRLIDGNITKGTGVCATSSTSTVAAPATPQVLPASVPSTGLGAFGGFIVTALASGTAYVTAQRFRK